MKAELTMGFHISLICLVLSLILIGYLWVHNYFQIVRAKHRVHTLITHFVILKEV